MKLSKSLFALLCALFVGNANAADITIFYSPTCPHCHHAREFIENNLIYEYDDLKVTTVNVMDADNRSTFFDTLKKCGYERGGVPVLVVGEKCFQGYADNMQSELRDAVEIDLNDAQKSSAAKNRDAMKNNRDGFIAEHSERKNAVVESKKKINDNSGNMSDILLYGFIILLLIGLGIIVFKKQK